MEYQLFFIRPNKTIILGTDLFRDKTSDLKNQKLNVVTFEHIPATKRIPIPETNTSRSVYSEGEGELGFSGLEIEV